MLPPVPEVCNGADDDGNGTTDEIPAACADMYPDAVASVLTWACDGKNATCSIVTCASGTDTDGKSWNGCESGVATFTSGETTSIFAMSDVGNDRIITFQAPSKRSHQIMPYQGASAAVSSAASDGTFKLIGTLKLAPTTLVQATLNLAGADLSASVPSFSVPAKTPAGAMYPAVVMGSEPWLSHDFTPGLLGVVTASGPETFAGGSAVVLDQGSGLMPASTPSIEATNPQTTPMLKGALVAAYVTTTGELRVLSAPNAAGAWTPVTTLTKKGISTTSPPVVTRDGSSGEVAIVYIDGTNQLCAATSPDLITWANHCLLGATAAGPFAAAVTSTSQNTVAWTDTNGELNVALGWYGLFDLPSMTQVSQVTTGAKYVSRGAFVLPALAEGTNTVALLYVGIDDTLSEVRIDLSGNTTGTDLGGPRVRSVVATKHNYVAP
jgi:hypothetical protein